MLTEPVLCAPKYPQGTPGLVHRIHEALTECLALLSVIGDMKRWVSKPKF